MKGINDRKPFLRKVMHNQLNIDRLYSNLLRNDDRVEPSLNEYSLYDHKLGIWSYNLIEETFLVSDQFKRICGIAINKPIKLSDFFAMVIPEDVDEFRAFLNSNNQLTYHNSLRIHHSKRITLIQISAKHICEGPHKGSVMGFILNKEDQLFNHQQFIHNGIAKTVPLHAFSDNTFWIYDIEEDKFQFLSEAIEDLLPYKVHYIYQNPELLLNHCSKKDYINFQQGVTVSKEHNIGSHNKQRWVRHIIIPYLEKEKLLRLYGVIVDITNERELKQQKYFLHYHDWLTKLPNQKKLNEKLNQLIIQQEKFNLFHIKLNRLAVINDSLGYQIGDAVLIKVTERINKVKHTIFNARLASNEFVLVSIGGHEDEIINKYAKQIIELISRPILIEGHHINMSSFIGVASYPKHGKTVIQLLDNAHYALNEAKKLGKNRFQVFYQSHNISSFKTYTLEQDLQQAIRKNEFMLFYQPKVNVKTGELDSMEALIRWQHSSWGVVSPAEFIPLAEENHLINDITDWVIAQVVYQLYLWKKDGLTLYPVSINIPPSRFLSPKIVEVIVQQLDSYHIPAKYIELEITERTLIKDVHAVRETIKKLKQIGVTIALDDFGTGYSSLKYLRTFQIDVLKIDQLFIRNIGQANQKDAAIISSIIHLAKSMEMKVVAEGVETAEQYQFLHEMNCGLIQGYLFSKPVPVNEINLIMNKGYFDIPNISEQQIPTQEQRSFFRCQLPQFLKGELTIIELNQRRVNLGVSNVLIENISIAGLKFLSTLNLPVQSDLKLAFQFTLLGKSFYFIGRIIWRTETLFDTIYYGVEFTQSEEQLKERLAVTLHKLTSQLYKDEIINMDSFITENPHDYLQNNN
ncbi:diguanylate cyclase (GGDEF) domain-containing protein [Amphibacillus marinus]|uniref:Diguanylate cyclase (GGDEF) domain-containing protein n=1 Tax=Amphibacillus marinus TaxID=872970 RepID=A0A1H8QWF4_9BACI|nr:EAL domain-containing protein [Amphibacillus marinus]SEO58073.1 diguanylate cyclase (GGDEF) domain-containing protein [Amphibacillus marinus]